MFGKILDSPVSGSKRRDSFFRHFAEDLHKVTRDRLRDWQEAAVSVRAKGTIEDCETCQCKVPQSQRCRSIDLLR